MAANTAQYIDSKDMYFLFNSQDVSSHCVSVDIPLSWKANDITAFGSAGSRVAASIFDTEFTAEFMFNQVATTGTQTIVGAAWYAKTAYAFNLSPAGVVAGNTKYTGNAFVTDYHVKAKMGDTIMVTATFKTDNGVVVGTN